MTRYKHAYRYLRLLVVVLSLEISSHAASDHQGHVRFGEVPVPGVAVTAMRGGATFRSVTDWLGVYSFSGLSDGVWTIHLEMRGFAPIVREVTIDPDMAATIWDFSMLPIGEIRTELVPGFFSREPVLRLLSSSTSSSPQDREQSTLDPAPDTDIGDLRQRTADGLLINGSVNNGASTPFALPSAFGNNRRAPRSLYTGNVFVAGNNSLFDARSFSLTGHNTAKPAYSRVRGSITFGGPLQIPNVFSLGTFSVSYSRTQNRDATLQTAQMPSGIERLGDFSADPASVTDPVSGLPFAGNTIPEDRISPQARALLDFFPSPNFTGGSRYNYQLPVIGVTHGDNIQVTINNVTLTNADRLSGTFSLHSTRSDNPDLFGLVDRTNTSGINAGIDWVHRFTPRIAATIRYQSSRTVTETAPHFSNRRNVSGDAGIAGNDQDPRNWGPPSLTFSSGIARLSSGSYAFDRNQSHIISYGSNRSRGRHALSYGADFRWLQFNLYSQRDARGSFTFTGAASGNDFADFLLGIPTTSALAFGNPDKYFRQSLTSAYVTNDLRLLSSVTLNVGVRWEYESPITEKYGRLVNLDIQPGFVSATPVIAGSEENSLVHPDRIGVQPRIGLAWRPLAASSLVVRAGYGIYRDTSVYRTIADQMAQQSPLSKSLSVQNTAENPLTLADGFRGSPSVTATTFAIDPNFRVGNAQNWNLSLQQDLPFAMQMTVTYLGIKGTHVPQRILPNTFPAGAANPCPSCPAGFVYLTSNGNTNRHAGTIEVRRRQRNGFEASARYTYSKAIDDAGLGGGSHIAQNWLDLRAERGLSNFDQRHELAVQGQYTTGSLAGIGTFWDGWRGKILKDWKLMSQWTIGNGSPLTPIILAPVSGTGVTGSLRPNVTGAPLYTEAPGGFLNPLAFIAPEPGEWGNAGRNTITGPGEFSLNASLTRTFRINERISMDLRVDATNVLNHVTYPNWNTTVNSAQFGLPARANAMRTLQPSLRVRF